MKIDLGKDYESDLKSLIEICYFNDNNGKLNNKNKSSIEVKKSDPISIMLKGLNNMTVRVINNEIIDGSSRFVVDEKIDTINLIPCNIYCIIENDKYSFY